MGTEKLKCNSLGCGGDAVERWTRRGNNQHEYGMCARCVQNCSNVSGRYDVVRLTSPKCPCTREQDCEACSTQPASPYVTLGSTIGRLVTEKQAAYGDSFGKAHRVIEILYEEDLKRGGIPPEKLPDLLTMVRVIDKQFRIATARDALGENPWRDMAGYSLLAAERTEKETNKEAA